MIFRFNIAKTIQACAVLLKTEGNQMTRLRLLKLLYIADRESLPERARPITGDRPVAMDHGPVLTTTYNLMNGEDALAIEWDKYFRREGQHTIGLIADPGVGALSRFEMAKLHDVARRFEQMNDWELSEHTHTFQEWKKNKPPKASVKAIPDDDVLRAAGLLGQKKELAASAAAEAALDRLLHPG